MEGEEDKDEARRRNKGSMDFDLMRCGEDGERERERERERVFS